MASTFSELIALSVAYALVFGATMAVHVVMLRENVGVQKLGTCWGVSCSSAAAEACLDRPLLESFDSQMHEHSHPTVHIKKTLNSALKCCSRIPCDPLLPGAGWK